MEVTIQTTLISSGTALLVSFAGLYVSSSKQRKNSIEIETLKFELEKERLNLQEKREAKKELSDMIRLSLEYIQNIKDNILALSIYLVHVDRVEEEDFSALLRDIEKYVELFGRSRPMLGEFEIALLHDMKGKLIGIRVEIQLIMENRRSIKECNRTYILAEISKVKGDLTDLQSLLTARFLTIHENPA